MIVTRTGRFLSLKLRNGQASDHADRQCGDLVRDEAAGANEPPVQCRCGRCEDDAAEESTPAQGAQSERAAWWEGLVLARAVGLTFTVGRARLGAGIGVGLIGAVVVSVGVGRRRHEPIVVTGS